MEPPAGTSIPETDAEPWLREHSAYLLGRARLRLPSWHAAEDVVQETLVAAWRERANCRGPVRPWLNGILRRKIADHFRALFRERSALNAENEAFPALFEETDGHWKPAFKPSAVPSQKDSRDALEARESLHGCLSGLPPSMGRMFVLREVEGYDTEEICAMTGVSRNLLWVSLHRARIALRSCLENLGYRPAPAEEARHATP